MKMFWAVLAALVVVGGAYVFVSARASESQARQAQQVAAPAEQQSGSALEKPTATQAAKDQQTKPAMPSAAELEALKKQQDEVAAQLARSKTMAPATEQKAAAPEADRPAPSNAKGKPTAAAPPSPKPEAPKPTQGEDSEGSAGDLDFSITDGTVSPIGVTGSPTTPKPVVAVPKAEKKAFAGFEIIPAKIEKKDDGSMLVDGKYVIKGEGTADKPYIVPWDVLTSVEETFDPQSEKKRLPERVTMLDGKIVKLSGYVAFPMMVKEAKECLSMLNQWDGCCIGTPPTPYDAVEVALKRTIAGEERFTTSGTVIGTFRVKPYLQGDWLIGLYVMEAGDLKSRDYGGAAGN
jgi:hypothetical protein